MSASERFLPARLAGNASVGRTRAARLVMAAMPAAVLAPLAALACQLLGHGGLAAGLLAGGAGLLCAPLLLRAGAPGWAARELFLCGLFGAFFWLSWQLGGVSAPSATWLITVPLLALFLGGAPCALGWLALGCAALALLYVGAPSARLADLTPLYLACDLGLFATVLTCAVLFELSKTRGFLKLEQALGTINELAIRDELTGIHNRRHLIGLVEREKERSDRNGRGFCLCLLDIDFFKRVNDTWGHIAGDAVLRAVAGAVQANVRASDSCGRYGGEEFLMMLPETTPADAMVLAERLRAAVEALRCREGGSEIALTVSIGVAEYRCGEAIGLTVARADEALYLAKSTGRNRVVCHEAGQVPALPADAAPAGPLQAAPQTSAADGGDFGASVGRLLDGVHCDQLTGLLNRRLLRDRLRHAMARADRNGRMVALLLLNINRFKEVNDALGYEVGDALLVRAGAVIRNCLRDCDTVARWSGDEFIALLEDLGDAGDARQVAEKILDRFGLPLEAAGRDCFVTLSVGVTVYPAPDCDLDALLRRADVAMRAARSLGENNVQLYASAACLPPNERLVLKNGLRDALARDQFFLEYQPQLDLATRRIVGVEALLRWQHPVYGRIDPGRFVPLAEETGMIVPIGDWVLRTACEQNRAWRAAGLPAVKTAVNLSARQLRHPGIAARVCEIVQAAGLPPGCLDLELTEGMLIDDFDANRRVMADLRAAGVLVSIDDFGTGYSSLNYLSELPLDILKMDGLFVRRLGQGTSPRAFAIAEAIVAMAHRLSLSVVAESVETPEQLSDLMAMGCDQAQGYLFYRPLPAEQVGALLAGTPASETPSALPSAPAPA